MRTFPIGDQRKVQVVALTLKNILALDPRNTAPVRWAAPRRPAPSPSSAVNPRVNETVLHYRF